MRSHISVHRGTLKFRLNSFVFKNEIEKEGLPRDTAPALGAGGPRFKSGRPDQNTGVFSLAYQKPSSPNTSLWNSLRQEVLIRKSCDSEDFAAPRVCKNTGRQECNSDSIEQRQVKRARSGK